MGTSLLKVPSVPYSRQESPRFAPRIVGRLELADIAEEMPFEMRVLEAALDFVRGLIL